MRTLYRLILFVLGAIGVAGAASPVSAQSAGTIEFALQFYTVAEPSVTNLAVARTGGSAGAVSAVVSVASGSAARDVDYTFADVVITFADGDSAPKVVPVTVVDDALTEPPETIVFELGSVSGGANRGATHLAVVTVPTSDWTPTFPAVSLSLDSPVQTTFTNLVTFTTTRMSVDVSGSEGVHSGSYPSPVTWTSDRGYQGYGGFRSGERDVPHDWSARGIPLQGGVNTLTFTVYQVSNLKAAIVLIVMVPAYDYAVAEGAGGTFFHSDLVIANPTPDPAPITITHLTAGGVDVQRTDTIAPWSRNLYALDETAGLDAPDGFATSVTSHEAIPLAIERTTQWGEDGYGAHSTAAADGYSRTWYFAEGAQGFFQTYLLLANPDAAINRVTVNWLREGRDPLTTTYALAPRSRATIFAGAIPGLVDTAFGMVVTFETPGAAERAMYFGEQPFFKGGHASVGACAPSQSWHLAEGATGTFFSTYILIANPNQAAADVWLEIFTPGEAIVRQMTVAPMGRATIDLAAIDPALAHVSVATIVTSKQPVVAERSQYWPATGWYEAHNSFGLPLLGNRWAIADGRVGGSEHARTYLLVFNRWPDEQEIEVTFLYERRARLFKRFTIPPRSRLTLAVIGDVAGSDVPELVDSRFSALIEAEFSVTVERATYTDGPAGPLFRTGVHVNGTRLP
jgi:Calx-beta domain